MLVRKSFQIFFPIIHSISYYWIHQYLETLDEKLQALEKNLTKELEEIKTLLNVVLENKMDMQKLAKLYDNYDEDKSDALSPRQSEIDNFNNTLQRTSLLNGLYRNQRFCWDLVIDYVIWLKKKNYKSNIALTQYYIVSNGLKKGKSQKFS